MVKIQGHDFNIGASIRVFLKGEADTFISPPPTFKFSSLKAHLETHGAAVKVDITPTSGEKTFMDSVSKFVESVPGNVALEPTASIHALNHFISEETTYNAYTGKPVVLTTPIDTDGRGDVVINWTKEEVDPTEATHFEACSWLAKTLDQYLGLPSLLWDKDCVRRQERGAPGNFIPTAFGMKYRGLSNLWAGKPQYCSFVYNNTLDAIKALFDDEKVIDKEFFGETARSIIDHNDVKSVAKLLDFTDIKSPKFYREKLGIGAGA